MINDNLYTSSSIRIQVHTPFSTHNNNKKKAHNNFQPHILINPELQYAPPFALRLWRRWTSRKNHTQIELMTKRQTLQTAWENHAHQALVELITKRQAQTAW